MLFLCLFTHLTYVKVSAAIVFTDLMLTAESNAFSSGFAVNCDIFVYI